MKALVIVDMQNDFITGPLGSKEAEVALKNLNEWAKENIDAENDMVVFTMDTHNLNYPNTQEGRKLPIEHCLYCTEGWMIEPSFIRDIENICIRVEILQKDTFGTLNLVKYLVNPGIKLDEVIFAGVCTDICVISNALILKAMCPELPIKVLGNCCAGTTPEKHEAALSVMESCQIDVI